MHVILGGTGHIGSALAQALLDCDEPVLIVTHDADKRSDWGARGAEVAVVDVADTHALREVFRRGTRAFLLNPPADPSGATTGWGPAVDPSSAGWASPTPPSPPATPTPPIAPVAPVVPAPGTEAPQWDEARGTYIQWDPVQGAWMQWDEGTKAWSRIAGQ